MDAPLDYEKLRNAIMYGLEPTTLALRDILATYEQGLDIVSEIEGRRHTDIKNSLEALVNIQMKILKVMRVQIDDDPLSALINS